ncbi:Mechanosensitive channel MscK [Paraburkholderia nemoris]|uniref:mechanosensitive ion channel domain-containing protein n=1 Tax=Paraburkholderia nemoris TaxID=2793076 RepID=UPI0019095198|nr:MULTISPECIES: mechanosensitive ion channel domain-containing protein [Paraburkholderia]MBK3785682.1 mechanosensitive ion channel [Paraburkholderia aspalathi]CAE6817222.1 Mechanosensitive channel MscK [Paraburkholderia nemoris]
MSSPTRRLALAFDALLDKAMACCGQSVPDKARLVGPLTIARLLLVGATMTAVVAQAEPPEVRSNADLSVEQVRRTAREAEARRDIDVPTKARIAELSRATLADLERVPELRAQAQNYRQLMHDAPDQIRDLERTLEQLRAESDQAVAGPSSAGSTLNEMEQALAQAGARQAAARAELAMLDLETERVDTEPAELRNTQREAQAGLERLREEIQTASGASRQTLLAQTELQAKRAALLVRQAESEVLRDRIDAQPLLARLTQLRREVVRAQLQRGDTDLKQLVALVDQRRVDDARRAEEDAAERQRQLVSRSPSLSRLAAANVQSSAQLAGTAKEIESLRQARDQRAAEAEHLAVDFQRARLRLERSKLTESLARVLAERAAALPEAEQFRRARGERARAAESIAAAAFQVEREQRHLANPDQELDTIMRNAAARTQPAEVAALRDEAGVLIADRKELLDRLSTSQRTYLNTLDELVAAEDQLLGTAQDYRRLIDKALFWVPVTPLSERSFSDLPQALLLLASPEGWREVGETIEAQAQQRSLQVLVLAGAVLAILAARKRLLARLQRLDECKDAAGDRNVAATVQALGTTLLVVAPLPLAIWTVGNLIVASPTASEFANAIGEGLDPTAWGVFIGLFFSRLFRPDGIAQLHFGLEAQSVRALRRASRVFTFLVVPLGFVNRAASQYDDLIVRASLGRLTHMLALIVFAGVIGVTFRPGGRVLSRYFGPGAEDRNVVMKYAVYVFACVVPLSLAVLSAVGFYNAAQVFGRLTLISCLAAAAIALFHTLTARWLGDQRDELERARTQGMDREVEVLIDGARKNLDRPDLASIGAQATRLLRALSAILLVAAVLVVWHGALPGLSRLNEISLWTYTDVEEGQTVERAVTLGGVMLALTTGFVAIVAVKNIGGFLDIALPDRARLSGGSRYAIRTVARYVIVGGAVMTVFSVLGGNWSRIQWLVAAMGVGLGFGLQEIFANFVSGLIILFERPIRIGDTVTVADVTGVVTRVQARATTVTDFDRKEVVIPNKTVITERVINWTLSDHITRVVLKVGVAYGSDTEATCESILKAVRSVPNVLTNPAPSVFFLAFGDSSLNFEARFFVEGVNQRIPATHDVLTAIERGLRQAGVEIPFPQHDVHLKSGHPALPAHDAVQRTEDGAAAGATAARKSIDHKP